jgi:hypothetical protein
VAAAGDPRVHAALFVTGRLTDPPVAGFHDWIAIHFHLQRGCDAGGELWIRQRSSSVRHPKKRAGRIDHPGQVL